VNGVYNSDCLDASMGVDEFIERYEEIRSKRK